MIARSTVSKIILDRVRTSGPKIGFVHKPTRPESGAPLNSSINNNVETSFEVFFEEARHFAFGLRSLGLEKGDRVALMARTRFEWTVCDTAIMGAGGTSVPIHAVANHEEIAHVLDHSGAKIAIVETENALKRILEIRSAKPESLDALEHVIVIDSNALAATAQKEIYSLSYVKELGRQSESRDPKWFENNLEAIEPDDLMTICYTSGTTGLPKGVMLTHANFASVIEDAGKALNDFIDGENEIILSCLPFSHIIGRIESLCPFVFGWKQHFSERIDRFFDEAQTIKPTILFAVPRMFERLYAKAMSETSREPSIGDWIFSGAVKFGRNYLNHFKFESQSEPSFIDNALFGIAQRFVFKNLKEALGGHLKFAICGGSALAPEISEFFHMAGIRILESYGLTETCAPITLVKPSDSEFGSVGKPLPDVSLKFSDAGEILVQSKKVFAGYYRMPQETERAFQNGWFKTGDVGYIDDAGFLHVTDRLENIIARPSGVATAPQKIELRAKTLHFIDQMVVFGDERDFLVAIITLEKNEIIKYASSRHILFSEYSELVRHPKVIALVQKLVDQLNSEIRPEEHIRRFNLLPNDFSVEDGELTPSLKVKRSLIREKYGKEIEEMYRLDETSQVR